MDELLRKLRALAEPTRLRIVTLLFRGELTVSELMQILGQSQPRVSRHLKMLVDAGLAERLPEGAWVFYRLAKDAVGEKLAALIDEMAHAEDPDLERDLERLSKVKQARAEAAQRKAHNDVRRRVQRPCQAYRLAKFGALVVREHAEGGEVRRVVWDERLEARAHAARSRSASRSRRPLRDVLAFGLLSHSCRNFGALAFSSPRTHEQHGSHPARHARRPRHVPYRWAESQPLGSASLIAVANSEGCREHELPAHPP